MTKPYIVPHKRLQFEELKREIFNIYRAVYSQKYKNTYSQYSNHPQFDTLAYEYGKQMASVLVQGLYGAWLFFTEDRNDSHNKIKETFTLDLTGSIARKIALKYLCNIYINYAYCQGADVDCQIAKYPRLENGAEISDAQMDDFFATLKNAVSSNANHPSQSKGNWKHFSYGLLEISSTLEEAMEFLLSSMHVRINVITGEFIFLDKESYDFFMKKIIHIPELETLENAQFDLGVSFKQRVELEKIPAGSRNEDWHNEWEKMEDHFIQTKTSRNRLAHYLYTITDMVRFNFTLHPKTAGLLQSIILKNESILLHLYNKFLHEKNKQIQPADSMSVLIKNLFEPAQAQELILKVQAKAQERKQQLLQEKLAKTTRNTTDLLPSPPPQLQACAFEENHSERAASLSNSPTLEITTSNESASQSSTGSVSPLIDENTKSPSSAAPVSHETVDNPLHQATQVMIKHLQMAQLSQQKISNQQNNHFPIHLSANAKNTK